MKLSDIFNHLTHGEFSQLNIGGSVAGEISESNYAAVISHINLALMALYVRFPLKFKEANVTLVPDQTDYVLETDDLLKIETIKTAEGYELEVNNPFYLYSLFTPTPSTIQVPETLSNPQASDPDWAWTDSLRVVYRASHPVIDPLVGGFDPATKEIELPPMYLQALLYNVASRANMPFGAAGNYHAGDSYLSRYEQECQRLELAITPIERGVGYDRIRDNGWV